MKRLKNALLGMEPNTNTYHEMYEGRYVISAGIFGNPTNDDFVEYDPTYWHEDFACSIRMTHKFAQDKPTLVWRIPAELLGITEESPAAADFCLRAFAPFIDKLNKELYNRSRPDDETGKYYLYRPNGKVLIRSMGIKLYDSGQNDEGADTKRADHAKSICMLHGIIPDLPAFIEWEQERVLFSDHFTSYPEKSGSERLSVSDMGFIMIGDERIDIRGLHDVVSESQLDAVGFMLR